MSFLFLEIVGEPGSGKTTLIQFLWKLFGRDYEGFDPSKSTAAGRMRTFTQGVEPAHRADRVRPGDEDRRQLAREELRLGRS